MIEKQGLEYGQIWVNTRRGFKYVICGFMLWSDSPDEDNLETFVRVMNMDTGVEYCRSVESFRGRNRHGTPRFVRHA